MELNDIAKKVQKYLEDTPLVVLGSGASVPYGLPTMGSLGKQILNDSNIQKINCFKSFEKDINTIGLESAINRNELSEETKDKIREITWEQIENADSKLLIELLKNCDRISTVTALLKKIIEPTPNQAVIVTTNYDHIIEYAADILGVCIENGFEGFTLRKFDGFDSAVSRKRQKARNRVAKILKVHGSLDWFIDSHGSTVSIPHSSMIPENYKPLIVPPGKDKYKSTNDEPYRSIIAEADKKFRRAKSYLCVGYGFNDAHIQPILIEEIKKGKPVVIATMNATDSCVKLIINSGLRKYIVLEKADNGTHVISDFGEEIVCGDYWSLDGLLKVW